jgi:hypothetical protein
VRVLYPVLLRTTLNGRLLTRIEDGGSSSYGNRAFEPSAETTGNVDDYVGERAPTSRPFAGTGRRRECLNRVFI